MRELRISRNIKALRLSHNRMTQDVLSEELAISRQTISKWERSESMPDLQTCIRIADFFEVSLDDLITKKYECPEEEEEEIVTYDTDIIEHIQRIEMTIAELSKKIENKNLYNEYKEQKNISCEDMGYQDCDELYVEALNFASEHMYEEALLLLQECLMKGNLRAVGSVVNVFDSMIEEVLADEELVMKIMEQKELWFQNNYKIIIDVLNFLYGENR